MTYQVGWNRRSSLSAAPVTAASSGARSGLTYQPRLRPRLVFPTLLLSVALAACGGGGGGDGGAGGGNGGGAGGAGSGGVPVTVSLQPSATQVANGGKVNLSWSSTNADQCAASGAWSGALAQSGLKEVGPLTASSDFKVTCSNSQNSADASTRVAVTFAAGQTAFRRIVLENGTAPWIKAFGDIDGDGFKDLVVGGGALGSQLYWYKLGPTLDAPTKHLISTSAEADHAIVADVNGDGRPDVVAVSTFKVTWYENPGNTTQQWVKRDIDSNFPSHDIAVGKFNNDDKLDIVVRSQYGGGVRLYLQQDAAQGANGWTPVTFDDLYLGMPAGLGLAVHDIDKDTAPDIVLNGRWLRNPGGAGTANRALWTNHQFADFMQWPVAAVSVADIDGDTIPDIVLAASALQLEGGGPVKPIVWFKGLANPTATNAWVSGEVVSPSENVHDLRIFDVNRDGKADVVFGEMYGGTNHRIAVAYGNGGTNWTVQVLHGDGSHGLDVADLNNAGLIALAGANATVTAPDGGSLSLWVNPASQN